MNGRVLCLAAVLAALSGPARAGSDDEIKLGPVAGYGTEGEAAAHCKGDGVVWADRKTGFLYPRFMEQYGHTPDGTYTCYAAAKKADYWGFGVIDSWGLKGKSFPISTCSACS